VGASKTVFGRSYVFARSSVLFLYQRSRRSADPHNRCDSGSWAGRRPRLGGYITGTGATDGVTAAGGR